jgi:hypothetical protein
MLKIAILDDYTRVALDSANWSPIANRDRHQGIRPGRPRYADRLIRRVADLLGFYGLLKIGPGSHAWPIALRIARRTRVANSGTL